jgi:V8-like Glu-specific endopeptidase
MSRSCRFFLTLTLVLSSACSEQKSTPAPKPDGNLAPQESVGAKVIYGDDNRLDLYQLGNSPWSMVAGATVALMRNTKLVLKPRSVYEIKTSKYSSSYDLCQEEPFFDQGTAAFCSGFFVGNDIVVTAGHCIRDNSECNTTSIVFGFALKNAGDAADEVPASQVYRCSQVIKSLVSSSDGVDYAVIRLDRPVADVEPVKLRSSGTANPGDELVVIGHPAGLPTKVAADGIVRRVESGFLVAGLDTYGGNSGSAVFNAKTLEVEGILVRGEMDFVYKGDCRVSNVCDTAACRGEDVTRIEFPRSVIP